MPGSLAMIKSECIKEWERRRLQTTLSHSVANKLSVFQPIKIQATSYFKDNVFHAGEGEGVYCHMVQTNCVTHVCVLWYSASLGHAHSYQYSICERHSSTHSVLHLWTAQSHSVVANDLAIDVRKKPTTNYGKLSHTHVYLLFVVCSLCLCCENESTRWIQWSWRKGHSQSRRKTLCVQFW